MASALQLLAVCNVSRVTEPETRGTRTPPTTPTPWARRAHTPFSRLFAPVVADLWDDFSSAVCRLLHPID